MILLLTVAALAAEFPPVVEELSSNASIDWTELRLQISDASDRTVGAWKDRRVQEQDALDRLSPQIPGLAEQVCVTPDSTAGDLMDGSGELARRLQEGVDTWRVAETRYHSSGSVELDASLDLRVWLRPALTALAASEALPVDPNGPTGLVLDARGLRYHPCLAPIIQTADGTPIFRAQMLTEDTAQRGAPVAYVTDPADSRAVQRAGDHPLFLRATAVRGGALILDPTRSVGLAQRTAAIASDGRVVIVVGP